MHVHGLGCEESHPSALRSLPLTHACWILEWSNTTSNNATTWSTVSTESTGSKTNKDLNFRGCCWSKLMTSKSLRPSTIWSSPLHLVVWSGSILLSQYPVHFPVMLGSLNSKSNVKDNFKTVFHQQNNKSYLVLTAPTHSLGLPSKFSFSVETVCDCPIAAETRINNQHTGKPKATYNCSIQGCSDRSNCKSQCSYYTCRLETCTTLHKSFVHVASLLCQPDVHRSYIACIHLIINSQASSSIHSLLSVGNSQTCHTESNKH